MHHVKTHLVRTEPQNLIILQDFLLNINQSFITAQFYSFSQSLTLDERIGVHECPVSTLTLEVKQVLATELTVHVSF